MSGLAISVLLFADRREISGDAAPGLRQYRARKKMFL